MAAVTALVIHLLNNDVQHKVHFIHPTYYLKHREQETFQTYWQLYKLEERVNYLVGLDELESVNVGDRDILIFDESDDFLFGVPERFLKVIGSNSCICYTATPGGSSSSNYFESDVLKYMKFTVIDGGKVNAEHNKDSELFKVDEVIEDADLVNFVDASSKKRPVLVYCRPEEADNLKQTLTYKTSIHQDEDILKVLGSLESSEYAN